MDGVFLGCLVSLGGAEGMLDLQEGKHFSWYVLWSPDMNGLPIQFLLVLLG